MPPTDSDQTQNQESQQSGATGTSGVMPPPPNQVGEANPQASRVGDEAKPDDAFAAEVEKIRSEVDAKLAEALQKIDAVVNGARDETSKAVNDLQTWLKDEMTAHREALDSHAEQFNKGLSDAINTPKVDPAAEASPEAPTTIEGRIAKLESDVSTLKSQVKNFV